MNPQLAALTDSYNGLGDAALAAAEALLDEANAEKSKIVVANDEAAAIAAGTKAYQEREETLQDLAKRTSPTVDRYS